MPLNSFRLPVTHLPFYASDDESCWQAFIRDLNFPAWEACEHLLANPDQMGIRTLGDPTGALCWTCTVLDLRFLSTCECCGSALEDNNSGEALVFARRENFAAVGVLCRVCRETLPEDKRGGLGLIYQLGPPS